MSQPKGGHVTRNPQAERIASGWDVEMEDPSHMGSLDWNPPVINETVLPTGCTSVGGCLVSGPTLPRAAAGTG